MINESYLNDVVGRERFVQIVVDRFYTSLDMLEQEAPDSSQWLAEAFEKPDVQDFLAKVFGLLSFDDFIEELDQEMAEYNDLDEEENE